MNPDYLRRSRNINNEKRLTGVVEMINDAYGILRGTGEGDAYLSPNLIRTHNLRSGDRLSGLAVFHPNLPGATKAQILNVEVINGQEIAV